MHAVETPALVTEPDDVTPAWLTAVLRGAGHDIRVSAFDQEPVGTGLMARSHRFRLTSEGSGPSSVVIKFPSAEPGTRELGAHAYVREVGFYRDVAQRVTARIPGCHHADVSSDGTDFVLVLEDIADARQGDQIAACTPQEAERAVLNLARLHASTWAHDDLGRLPWLQRGDGPSLTDYMTFALEAFEPRFAGLVTDETWPVLRAFTERAARWAETEPSTRAAVHGDYRLDNLLFSTTDSVVTAVDWQTVDYVNPGRDLAYFLGNSLTTEDRRLAEADLVRSYLDELAAAGVDDYTETQCWADLRHGTFQGPLVTMLGAFTADRSERSEPMFAAMADRAAAQILDLDALDVLA